MFLLVAYSQQRYPVRKCSVILSSIGDKWRTDSLTTKGLRFIMSKELLSGSIDSVSPAFLFENLGKPDKKQKFYSGNTDRNYVSYIYYVRSMDDNPATRPFPGYFVEFVFDENETLLQYLNDGYYCG